MYVKIFALFVFVGVLGFTEARSGIFGYPYGNGGLEDRSSPTLFISSRSKRAVDSNGETTTKPTTNQATTTNPTTTDPTTTPPSSTTPPTSPTTTPSTEPTTPTTTPTTTTTEATSPTTISATTPTSTSTTPSTTTPESTKPTPKPKKSTNDLESRSNFDESEPEDSSKKPGSPSKGDKNPAPGPFFGSGHPGPFGPGFDPFYPGFNSIPGSRPNYAWTGTNNGPGFASAGASAGSFAGGYPGTGYPMAGYPGAGSPSVGGRGGFQDNTPNPNGYGYGGVDPLYNAGPGFYYPGQYPRFQDPLEMIRQMQAQIEAQIEAQRQALAKSMASNQGGPFASNIPNRSYFSASPNMNNVRYPKFGGSPNTGVGNSNMELHNRLANEAANYGSGGYGDDGSYGGSGPQFASANIGLGPRGGFQSGIISPAGPGIESRFAEDLPPPSGNFGVFASSSSSSRTGPDGKPINHKSSITGLNDNGKISYRTVHD